MIDYRKIIKSKNFRIKLLSTLSWVPDKIIVTLQYFIQTGKILHLNSPRSFNEKLQAYKLYYRNPEMLRCTDKLEVRKYVEEKGLGSILVPLLGIYEDVSDINFDKLPNCFVIKTTDGGGGSQIYICREKQGENKNEVKKKIKEWMEMPKPKKHIGREWAYDNGFKRRILIEELLKDNNSSNKDIIDYKFFCFNGKFKCLWIDKDRYINHKRGFWDENLRYIPEVECLYPPLKDFRLPENINVMIQYAEKLSKEFPFVRVDLYNLNGNIYFSELTFYPNSGYIPYNPNSFDIKLGSYFNFDLCK